jgi:hypothetical protein
MTLRRVHRDEAGNESSYPVLVSTGLPRILGGEWSGFDPHAPYNAGIRYEVTTPSGSAVSTWTVLAANTSWFVHASVLELSVPITHVNEIGAQSRKSRAGVHRVVGASEAVVVGSGSRLSSESAITVSFDRSVPVRDVWALLDADEPVLINTTAEAGWDVTWLWIQPGDVSMENAGRVITYRYRRFNVPYVACKQPDVAPVGPWTFGKAKATGRTFAESKAIYVDFRAARLNEPLVPDTSPPPVDPGNEPVSAGYGVSEYGTGEYGT